MFPGSARRVPVALLMMLTCFLAHSRLCLNEIVLRSVCQIAHVFSLGCQCFPPWEMWRSPALRFVCAL